jgi:hypothetical protein
MILPEIVYYLKHDHPLYAVSLLAQFLPPFLSFPAVNFF